MSERITAGMVKASVERVNKKLAARGSFYTIGYEGRNNYHALDLYKDGGCVDNIETGTPRELYKVLRGLRVGLDCTIAIKHP